MYLQVELKEAGTFWGKKSTNGGEEGRKEKKDVKRGSHKEQREKEMDGYIRRKRKIHKEMRIKGERKDGKGNKTWEEKERRGTKVTKELRKRKEAEKDVK